MRIVVALLAIICVLVWLGFELRAKDRALSNVLYAFAVLFALLLSGAFWGWY
jgi:hypothetical protein